MLPTLLSELPTHSTSEVEMFDRFGKRIDVSQPEVHPRGDRNLAFGFEQDAAGANDLGDRRYVLGDNRDAARQCFGDRQPEPFTPRGRHEEVRGIDQGEHVLLGPALVAVVQ